MINIRKLLVAAVAGIVFVATPAHASCLQETTEALVGLQRQIGTENPGPDYIRQAIKSDPNGAAQLARNISSDLSRSCQDLAPQNVLAYAGLGQPAEPAPQPAASQSGIGPGEQIDNRLEALEARDGSANVAAAEAAARRAEAAVAEARRERDAAATRLQQIVSRPGVTPAQINAATAKYQKAEKLLEKAEAKAESAKASAEAAARSAQSAANSAGLAATAQSGATKAADRSEAGAVRSETAATWLEAHQWMIWLAFAFALLALAVAGVAMFRGSRKQTAEPTADVAVDDQKSGFVREEDLDAKLAGLATKEEVAEAIDGVHGRIDRVTDDVQLDPNSAELLKAVQSGDEAVVKFLVNGEPGYLLTFIKVDDDHFQTTAPIGSTPARQDIGDPLSFIRRAHGRRQNDLEPFRFEQEAAEAD